jgi:hypothetical protein
MAPGAAPRARQAPPMWRGSLEPRTRRPPPGPACTSRVDRPAGAVHDDHEPPARHGDDLLAQQRPVQPLDQIERAALHFVGAVGREVDPAMLGEGRERYPCGRGLGRGALGCGNVEEAQALPVSCARASTGRRRAGTEPDDHAVADQLRSRLCRGALERVVLGAGAVSRAAQGSAANCCCGGCWRWPPGNPPSRKLSSRRRWSLRRPPPVPRWGDLRRRPSIIGCRSRSAHVARRARILGDTSGRKP